MSDLKVDDLTASGVIQRPACTSDLLIGRDLTLKVENGWAWGVHIRKDFEIRGTALRIAPNEITLRPAVPGAPEATFKLESNARIVRTPVERARAKPASIGEIRPGERLTVTAKEGRAFSVNIEPPPTIRGIVSSFDNSVLAVRVQAGSAQGVRRFHVTAQTEIYDDYFGQGNEPGSSSALVQSAQVSVSVLDERVTAISIIHPVINGIVASVIDGVIGIRTNPEDPQIRPFTTAANTQYFIGVKQRTEVAPDGRNVTYWNYQPGGAINEVKVGDKVSVTAKGSFILSMRVTPLGKRAVE